MRSYKPDWYSRLEQGPAGRTVFDEQMMRKVEGRVREMRQRPAGHGRRYMWAAGIAAIICLAAGGGVYYGMNMGSAGATDASPGVTAAPSEGPSMNVPSPTPASETYISEEKAIELAKTVDPKGAGAWTATFVQEAEVDPANKTKRPIWAVVETFPQGNKTTVSVDAVSGKIWTTGDVEAPSAAERAASLKIWEGIHALNMTDVQNGWAITKTAVLKTKDGGQHWSDVTNAGMKSNDGLATAAGTFPDGNTAIVAVPGGAGTINVFVTKNGGGSWEKATVNSKLFKDALPYIQSIQFPDVKHGYILAKYGAAMGSETASVFKTTDGGSTWTIVSETETATVVKGGLPFSGHKSGVTFIDANNGWLTGNWAGDTIYLYATHDGGATWEQQTIAIPKGANADGGAGSSYRPVFTDAQNGVMPVRLGPNGTIWYYGTSDGGKTWTAKQSLPEIDLVWSIGHDGSIAGVSGNQSWWAASGGSFVKTGQLPTKSAPTAISTADGKTAYAAGADFLAQTTDQGRTWNWSVPIVGK